MDMIHKLFIKRIYSEKEIYDEVLTVVIESLRDILKNKDLSSWEILLQNHQTSLEEAENWGRKFIEELEMQKDLDTIDEGFLSTLNKHWLNTFMYILYQIEHKYMNWSYTQVSILWDIFFTHQQYKASNYKNIIDHGKKNNIFRI